MKMEFSIIRQLAIGIAVDNGIDPLNLPLLGEDSVIVPCLSLLRDQDVYRAMLFANDDVYEIINLRDLEYCHMRADNMADEVKQAVEMGSRGLLFRLCLLYLVLAYTAIESNVKEARFRMWESGFLDDLAG